MLEIRDLQYLLYLGCLELNQGAGFDAVMRNRADSKYHYYREKGIEKSSNHHKMFEKLLISFLKMF